jgi:hypothetical protein
VEREVLIVCSGVMNSILLYRSSELNGSNLAVFWLFGTSLGFIPHKLAGF